MSTTLAMMKQRRLRSAGICLAILGSVEPKTPPNPSNLLPCITGGSNRWAYLDQACVWGRVRTSRSTAIRSTEDNWLICNRYIQWQSLTLALPEAHPISPACPWAQQASDARLMWRRIKQASRPLIRYSVRERLLVADL